MQYVFVIDDSDSMGPQNNNDPDRLAVFAVRALIDVLDEHDAVSVVRLNGPRDGESPMPLLPLDDEHRERIQRYLALDGVLARYASTVTPCRDALLAVRDQVLNPAFGEDARQILFLLTDGECHPPREQGRVKDLLDGLDSFQAGAARSAFQMYILRFAEGQTSPGLTTLATRTRGESVPAARRPEAVLHAFAQALSHAQYFEARRLNPENNRLGGHLGADGMRLLAIAEPGPGPTLGLELQAIGGGPAPKLEWERAPPPHRYPDGQTYRYVVGRYVPNGQPVSVNVTGDAGRWSLIALPDYDLRPETALYKGDCRTLGEPIDGVIGIDERYCVVARLIGASGEVIGTDFATAFAGKITVRGPGEAINKDLPVQPVRDRAELRLERHSDELGDVVFAPRFEIRFERGATRNIEGIERSLLVFERSVKVEAGSWTPETLVPGGQQRSELAFTGRFAPTRASFTIRGLPECVSAQLGDAAPETPFTVGPGDQRPLILLAEASCDGTSAPHDLQLHIDFPESDLRPEFVSLSTAINFAIRQAKPLEQPLTAGEHVTQPLQVPEEERQLSYQATIGRSPGWPRHLEVGFVDPADSKRLLREGKQVATRHQLTPAAAGRLRLRLVASRCAPNVTPGEDVWAEVTLIPDGGGLPWRQRVAITVTADRWACWLPRILGILTGLFAGLLVYYIGSMFRHTELLHPDDVAAGLVPLRWDRHGKAQEYTKDRGEVRRLVRRALSWPARWAAWCRANPLIFGLPGRRYNETLELNLEPRTDYQRSLLVLRTDRDLPRRLQEKEPEDRNLGKVFASAWGGTAFFAVPDRRFRLGPLIQERHRQAARNRKNAEPRMEILTRAKLVAASGVGRRSTEGAAGWRVG